ncbi:sigma-70 family RNA polymerase sigma factor [Stakelama pacifica]|uniref:RNA polymerase sigma-70 factor (ECF subfamily) n=1 Tax=Stakelama pacifica TaxID=517720 RepID=A0A4R6FD19_9SPHN|nr:sigma-70 family RNA polymerase sigma factor [Stakelama pacifica]TDN79023.1 RNA polymerase sigma-70 factor (ECF subfamily) [Stakelama pacifica]GGO98839.1 DNA-directed RNA polymerase sigma-70 factor [Stakelama pacifica]
MTESAPPNGLEAALIAHRETLLRFLRARGAGEAAEDVLHELWLKIRSARTGPIAAPLSYLYRAADTLMIDRFRAERQAVKRDRDWSEQMAGAAPGVSEAPSGERIMMGRDHARLVAQRIDSCGARAASAFRRHRIDGVAQREVARELGVSLSTVESDLRLVYRALAELREEILAV